MTTDTLHLTATFPPTKKGATGRTIKRWGGEAMSDVDLIAQILGTGVKGEPAQALAARILQRWPLGSLGRATPAQLVGIHGLGQVKAERVLAAVELAQRVQRAGLESELSPKPAIGAPDDVARHCADLVGRSRERLRVLALNTKNRIIAQRDVYRGTVNSASIRVAEILRPAIELNAPYIIIVHNHPSGDPTPSPEDVLVTRRAGMSADMMDIELLDHVVVASQGFVSMKQRNLGF